MASSSERKYVNDARTVVGYGDTKDLALNDLLEKLKAHESEIRCACSNEGEVCRTFCSAGRRQFPHLLAKEYWQNSLEVLVGPWRIGIRVCPCSLNQKIEITLVISAFQHMVGVAPSKSNS